MKLRIIFFVFINVLLSMVVFSCGESCDDGNCGENGKCVEDICICDDGYEGISCETEERKKFLGYWQPKEYDCNILSDEKFDFSVEEGSQLKDVIIKLHTGFDLPLNGTISGDSIIIPNHNFGTTYTGSLVINGPEMIMEIRVLKGTDSGFCNILARK